MKNTLSRSLLSLLLLFSLLTISLPQLGYAQTTGTATAAGQYDAALAAIEAKADARRKELGIPGVALAIVKDDKVIYLKGLGYKDLENKAAVTPDTQFAIGSATKAFTALSVLMTADEGKLSLDDSPKKLLPYFKMYDPETDRNITIRDLLCHSSGLNRTDLAMVTGKLTRNELIQVAAQAKPTAKLREKFQYQNIMFTAAGEIVANAQKMPWERFIPERVLKPLGMKNTSMSIAEMERSKDHSYGYNYNFDTKETTRLPYRELVQIAPAGSINSSARDMAEWLRFVMNGGTVNGKRLVSEANYAEWLKPQMKIAGTMSYGFGWFLQEWNGMKVVQHGGNIDGFNSMVAMIPEKKLGFVMLTNVSASSLGNDLMPIVWQNLLGSPAETTRLPLKTMQLLAGKYGTAERAVEVKIEGEDLYLVVPGQPPYKLERTAPRTFRAAGLPDGFGAKFTPETGDAAELELIQPQGNHKLPRLSANAAAQSASSSAARELIGKYVTPMGDIEISEAAGAVTLNIAGQQPYTLVERSKDSYSMAPLPVEQFSLKAKRDAAGKVAAIVVTQPAGEFEFKLKSGSEMPKITADELMQKVIDAAGGETAWRKLRSRVSEFDLDFENQGVKAAGTSFAAAPNLSATATTFTALGKVIGGEYEYFDGTKGEDALTFAPTDKLAGKRLEDVRIASDFYILLNWKTNYSAVDVTGMAKVGGEDCYVVRYTSAKGTNATEYISAKSFLILKREGLITSSTSEQAIPYTVYYSDYRDVDGVKLPFRVRSETVSNGSIVTTFKSIKHNTAIDAKVFGPRKP